MRKRDDGFTIGAPVEIGFIPFPGSLCHYAIGRLVREQRCNCRREFRRLRIFRQQDAVDTIFDDRGYPADILCNGRHGKGGSFSKYMAKGLHAGRHEKEVRVPENRCKFCDIRRIILGKKGDDRNRLIFRNWRANTDRR